MTIFSQRLRSAAPVLALSLSIVALGVQILASACLSGLMAPAGHSVIVCSVAGTHVVEVGDDGKPLPVSPDHQMNFECPLCVGFHAAGAFTAPMAVAILLPLLAARVRFPRIVPRVVPRRTIFTYDTRGPPAGFVPIAA